MYVPHFSRPLFLISLEGHDNFIERLAGIIDRDINDGGEQGGCPQGKTRNTKSI